MYFNPFVSSYHIVSFFSASWFLFLTGGRWLGQRLDLLSAIFTATIAFTSILLGPLITSNAAELGLILTYCTTTLGMFQYGVRQSTEVENLVIFPLYQVFFLCFNITNLRDNG